MTRKDYELIAERISSSREADARNGREEELLDSVSRRLADALASENPRFDRERFLRACGVEA